MASKTIIGSFVRRWVLSKLGIRGRHQDKIHRRGPHPLEHGYLRVFRGISKLNLPGYLGFFQFLRNFRQWNACEQAELILQAALDPAIASRAKKGEFVKCFDHFDLLQTARN